MASGYRLQYRDVVIDGSATSPEVELNGLLLVGIRYPASMSGTSITFTTATASGGTYVGLLRSDGTALSANVTSSKQVAFNPWDMAGVNFVKIVSSASETTKTVTLVLADA